MSPDLPPPGVVRKAVFPVAGLGTRFLPATKASPKEMLPVVDKPLVQYAVEEAVAAGIEVLVFINGRNKTSIPDHFDKAYELEKELEARGKQQMLEVVQGIVPPHVSCVYIRQAEALGLGHAVLCARPVVGNEPFAVLLADDLIDGQGESALAQMARVYAEHQTSVLGVEVVDGPEISRYGVVATDDDNGDSALINGIVEKPPANEAPSNLGVVGRYILEPRIFDLLEAVPRGSGGEYQLTDAIAALLEEQRVLAHRIRGRRYDCGSKLGYLQATVDYALKHPELREGFRDYLRELTANGSFSA